MVHTHSGPTLRDGLSCPRCHAAEVLRFCGQRHSAVYVCDCCEYRWEVAAADADVTIETVTVRITASTGYGADRYRQRIN